MIRHDPSFEIGPLIETITPSAIRDHLEALTGEKEPTRSPDALLSAASYLSQHFEACGLHSEYSPIEGHSDANGSPCFNVVAEKPGQDPSNKKIIIGAHYDTVPGSPGADDNASSLAVLLEVARLLSSMEGHLTPHFVAFSLEEQGFIGSTAYLNTLEEHSTPIFGALILECIGFTDHTPGSQKTPPGLPFVLPDAGDFIGLVGNETSKPIQTAFETAVNTYTPDLPEISLLVPGKGEALPDSRRSDHVPFWDKGYAAVMLTDTANFRNPHYHQPSDQVETLDLSFMVEVAKALAAAVIDLAGLKPEKKS